MSPNTTLLTLKELEERLMSLSDGRLQYSVECSHSRPSPNDWRLDLPVCGSGVNEEKRLCALLLET